MAKSVRRKSAPRTKTPSPGSAGEGRGGGASASPRSRPSSLLDTRVIYCGDCLEQLRSLPDDCVDLVSIDPPFSSRLSVRVRGNGNRNYEVFRGETKEKRAFEDRHASTHAYIYHMRPRCAKLARVRKQTGPFCYHCDGPSHWSRT